MIYAVNKRTKAHEVMDPNALYNTAVWEEVHADPDGWIEWQGGECPLPDWHKVEVRLKNGGVSEAKAGDYMNRRWEERDFPFGEGIIAYRPILDTKVSHPGTMAGPDKYRAAGGEWPEPPAWDGEGLPPVGYECEYDDCQHGWVRTRILAHHPNGSCAWHESVETDGFVDETSYSTDSAGAFRPIRSEEDRAVREMRAVIDACDAQSVDGRLSAIYRAIRDSQISGLTLEVDP